MTFKGILPLLPFSPNMTCAIMLGFGALSGFSIIKGIFLLSVHTVIVTSSQNGQVPGNDFVQKRLLYLILVGCWLASGGIAVSTAVHAYKSSTEGNCMNLEMYTGPALLATAVIGLCEVLASSILQGINMLLAVSRIKNLRRQITPENLGHTYFVLKRIRHNIRIAKIDMSVGGLVIISSVPMFLAVIIVHFNHQLFSYYIAVTSALPVVHAVGNIFVYRYRSQDFRRILHKMMKINLNRIVPSY